MAKITFGTKYLTKPKNLVGTGTSNLLLYWPMDAGPGDKDIIANQTRYGIPDLRGGTNSIDGTIVASNTSASKWVYSTTGNKRWVVRLNGIGSKGDYIGRQMSQRESGRPIDLPGFPTQNFVIQFFFRQNTNISDTGLKRVLTYGGNQHGDKTASLTMELKHSDELFEIKREFDYEPGSGSDCTGASIIAPATDGTWWMATVVCSTDTMKFFLNDGKLHGRSTGFAPLQGLHANGGGSAKTYTWRGACPFTPIKRPSISMGKTLESTSSACPIEIAELAIYGNFSTTDLDSTSSEWYNWFWTGTNRAGQTGSHDIFPENIRKNFYAKRNQFIATARTDALNFEASTLKV